MTPERAALEHTLETGHKTCFGLDYWECRARACFEIGIGGDNMSVNPGDQTTRLWIGTGQHGLNLRTTLETIAAAKDKTLSKLLVEAAIEVNSIDPATGKPLDPATGQPLERQEWAKIVKEANRRRAEKSKKPVGLPTHSPRKK